MAVKGLRDIFINLQCLLSVFLTIVDHTYVSLQDPFFYYDLILGGFFLSLRMEVTAVIICVSIVHVDKRSTRVRCYAIGALSSLLFS
jgi:hypothetical protein